MRLGLGIGLPAFVPRRPGGEPPPLYGLVDDAGGWPWDDPDYGLVDAGPGHWDWSADPDYVLDGDNQWVAAS